jgi:hypothetical protein
MANCPSDTRVVRRHYNSKRGRLEPLLLLAMLFCTLVAYGQNQCVALSNANPIPTVDGILSGSGIAVGPPPTCSANPRWAGVVPQLIQPVGPTMDTQAVYLFAAGHSGGANLDNLYVGVHVQNTPNLSTSDHVTLYFHFGSGASFASPDFAIEYDIGASAATPDATPTDSQCSLDPASTIRYYTFSGGTPPWTAQTPPAGITAKKSYNFVAAQPDIGIWELEVGLDLSNAGLNITVPSSGTNLLAIGAGVYADDTNLQKSTVYFYPKTLTSDTSTAHYLPGSEGVISPSSLQAFDVGSSCSNDVMITSIKATDANGNPGHFTRPTTVGGTANNQFSATAKFFNPANAGDNSILGSPNTGQVEFHIEPTNAAGNALLTNFDVLMGSPQVSFTRVNQEITIPTPTSFIVWPQSTSDWNSAINSVWGMADHACYIVKVTAANPFNVNVAGDANDVMQENVVFTTNSTVRDSFLISAKNTTLQPQNGYIDYVLRVNLRNAKNKTGWHFKFRDPDDIGLKKIPKAKGYYSLRLKPGEEKRVNFELSGVLLPGTSQKYEIAATAGGTVLSPTSGTAPLNIPVKSNTVMSIVARHLIHTGPNVPPNDANGVQQLNASTGNNFQVVVRKQAAAVALGRSLLKDGYYRTSDHQGALIGSFDGFQTAFVVGTDSTFVVPSNATTLSLAINDQAGQYSDNTGSFQLNVSVTDPLILPTAITQLPTINEGIPVQAASATGLPRLDIDVMQSVPDKKLLIPTGYVSWAIYDSHNDERCPLWWLWPGNWH